MIERILTVLKLKSLTPSQFADEIGIQRSGMSHLISGRNKPSLDFILKTLNRFPDIDPLWLLLGKTKTDQEVKNFEPLDVFAKKPLNESPIDVKPKNIQETIEEEKSESLVEKIVFFYRDSSFKEYHQK